MSFKSGSKALVTFKALAKTRFLASRGRTPSVKNSVGTQSARKAYLGERTIPVMVDPTDTAVSLGASRAIRAVDRSVTGISVASDRIESLKLLNAGNSEL